MATGLLFDVHVDHAIAHQLRIRGVDVMTAQEEGIDRLADDLLLDYATRLGRPIVTGDIRFQAMANRWLATGRAFCGMIFAHPMRVSIGRCVQDLELIAKATDAADWKSQILRLPV